MATSTAPSDTPRLPSTEYRRHYDIGWNASGGNPRATASMDAAEARHLNRFGLAALSPENHAWIDGWLDFASDREKYHFETCDGDCGQH